MIVLATTGAIIAFSSELRRLTAPGHYLPASEAGGRTLDWIALHDIAERISDGVASTLPLHHGLDEPVLYWVAAKPGAPPLAFDTLGLDPYSGKEIFRARDGDLREGMTQIVPFIEKLHFTLALGDWGAWLLGVAAFVWTFDCFVGFYLTLPVGVRSFWRRWRKAWTIKIPVPSRFRLQFDLHRASGLWLWPMLFVFAWSGVAFNLPSVYAPIMHVLTGYEGEAVSSRPVRNAVPILGWTQALSTARRRAAEALSERGVAIVRERELRYVAKDNVYAFGLRTSRDLSDEGANSWVKIDGDTGAAIAIELPSGERTGNTIDYWLGMLHEATVFGLPYRIFVGLMGVTIVVLTVTGVVVWTMKKASRHRCEG